MLTAIKTSIEDNITRRDIYTAIGLLALTIATRSFQIGYPLIHIDEQFYLLVGERMRDGALPYVDIWDRKPIGLFLLYAGLAALPGSAVLGYQAGAIAATTATAVVIARISRKIATKAAAWQSGAIYILFMPVFNSGMGQSPTYYNFLVALAALYVIKATNQKTQSALLWHGLAIMLILGLAIQIKYTVLFEGLAFGLILLRSGYERKWPCPKLLLASMLWIFAALLPTICATLYYYHLGYVSQYIFANFTSIFQRGSDGSQSIFRLIKEIAALLPFWGAIFIAPRMFINIKIPSTNTRLVIYTWFFAAFTGFLIFGTWYEHYVAPLLVPLSILSAPALARTARSERYFGYTLFSFGILAGTIVPLYKMNSHGTRDQFEQMNDLIESELNGGCLYIFEGELAFYRTLKTCLPTTRLFPNHLNMATEANAIGLEPVAELRRTLDSHPAVIVTYGPNTQQKLPNIDTHRLIADRLLRDYEKYGAPQLGSQSYLLYRRKQ